MARHRVLTQKIVKQMKQLVVWSIILLGGFGCQAQTKNNMTNDSTNPLLCDPEKGACELPGATNPATTATHTTKQNKPVKIIYFTDPICSSCWGIEPQLKKLKLEYGTSVEINYHMGGLLPDWSYNSGGISKPSDVAHHWDEVSRYYDMPIDGNVWLEDPLSSSYPPSIAFKAAQLQDEEKALLFLRRIREMVFLEKKNITKWEHLHVAATETGLDPVKLKSDYETTAIQLFQLDLELGGKLGVRGFPTLFFVDGVNNQQQVYGFAPYPSFEAAVLKLDPTAHKTKYDTTWAGLFGKFETLSTREFSELAGLPKKESETLLQKLADEGKLTQLNYRNGVMWTSRKKNP